MKMIDPVVSPDVTGQCDLTVNQEKPTGGVAR